MSAPMTADPSTAPSTSGKPWIATAVWEVSETAWAETTASATTRSRVRTAVVHASRGSTSAPRPGGDERADRQDRPHPRPATGRRLGVHRAPDGLDAVPDVGQAGTRGRRGGVEALPVVGHDELQAVGPAAQLHSDPAGAGVLDGVLDGLQAPEV